MTTAYPPARAEEYTEVLAALRATRAALEGVQEAHGDACQCGLCWDAWGQNYVLEKFEAVLEGHAPFEAREALAALAEAPASAPAFEDAEARDYYAVLAPYRRLVDA